MLPTGVTIEADSLVERLRRHTRPQHDAIEQVERLARLFAPDYALSEYRDLLGCFYGFYQSLEPVLFAGLAGPEKRLFAHRRKSSLLADDLRALGCDRRELNALPLCFDLPPLASWSQQVGVFYVLEGATLGGQVISRRLLAHFGERTLAGAMSFYRGYGEHHGREWRSFLGYLQQFETRGGADATAVVDAARATFGCLTAWLSAGPETWPAQAGAGTASSMPWSR